MSPTQMNSKGETCRLGGFRDCFLGFRDTSCYTLDFRGTRLLLPSNCWHCLHGVAKGTLGEWYQDAWQMRKAEKLETYH